MITSEQLFYIALVALGGAIGAILRYGLSLAFPANGSLSGGIFLVNLIGCFLICFVFFKFVDLQEAARVFIFVGLFGAFTTMSSVSLEMVQHFADGNVPETFFVFFMHAIVCLGAGFAGRAVALAI